jgi:hypothetical protein
VANDNPNEIGTLEIFTNAGELTPEVAERISAVMHQMGRATHIGLAVDRDTVGEIVRRVWVRYARSTNPNAPAHHLIPWDRLDEYNKEVDRQIGEAVFRFAVMVIASMLPEVKIELTGEVRWPATPDEGLND